MLIRLFILAITPSIALGLGIYLVDRYDREPILLLVKIFSLGALTVIPVFILQRILLSINIRHDLLKTIFTSFIIAGMTEEYFKREIVLRWAFNNPNFNERLDGIVYSSFSALGFATIENIMYIMFRASNDNYHIGILRGILSVPAHILFAITMGYYLSLAKYCEDDRLKAGFLYKSLLIPVVFHGIFNFLLMAKIPILMLLFIPYVIYLWKTNLDKLNKYTKHSKNKFNYPSKDE